MRVRILALLGAAALVLLGAVPAAASADESGGGSYLALGDSVPFGFSPLLNPKHASVFVGYPEMVAEALELHDVNATCPGEATGGFLSLTGIDNVCRFYRFVADNPLHVEYQGSQMDFALRYLRGHPDTRLVTLTLGANDFFRWQHDCVQPMPPPAVNTCAPDPATSFGVMLATMQANLTTIFDKIRGTGYSGLIVGMTYYSLTYPDTSGAAILNGPMQAALKAPGVAGHEASGVEAWRATAMAVPPPDTGSSCMAGLLIRLAPGPKGCDVHPTPLGRDLLAAKVLETIAATCGSTDARECVEMNH